MREAIAPRLGVGLGALDLRDVVRLPKVCVNYGERQSSSKVLR